jgi:hypothetical protein
MPLCGCAPYWPVLLNVFNGSFVSMGYIYIDVGRVKFGISFETFAVSSGFFSLTDVRFARIHLLLIDIHPRILVGAQAKKHKKNDNFNLMNPVSQE